MEWTKQNAIGRDSQRKELYGAAFGAECDFLPLVALVTVSSG